MRMGLPDDVNPPAGAAGALDRGGAAGEPQWQNREKQGRWGCASCPHYDPGCACCTYIHTPVSILFACPRALASRR